MKKMKKISIIIAIGLLAILCFNNPVQAQEKVFITFEYMHVKPGNVNAYLQIENSWRKIHQARLKKGNIVGWSVWEVVAPYKMDAPYQYVVMTVYPQFSNLLHPFDSVDIHQVFPNMSQDSLNKMFAETEKFLAGILGGSYQPDMPENVANRLKEITVDISKVSYEPK